MSNKKIGLHWFRRDLRLAGNPALNFNLKKSDGHVLGIFCFDSKFLSREDFSHNRFAFFIETIRKLREDLHAAGGDLLILDELPQQAFPRLIKNLKEKTDFEISLLTFNRDYEPYARTRDAEIRKTVEGELGIEVQSERDHLILEPHEVYKSPMDQSYYQVFTPFSSRWFRTLQERQYLTRIKADEKNSGFKITWKDVFENGLTSQDFPDQLEKFATENQKHVTIKLPQAGSAAAFSVLKEFKKHLNDYSVGRDIPSINGTSHLSIYLKNGSITTAQIVHFLELHKVDIKAQNGATKFLKELIWREFYYHILWHVPAVEKRAFREKYEKIRWHASDKMFKAWCEGKTGYPIVDAGMRQLNETGWMHNRVRMIVASFLSKDLLLDYKLGESYFMKMLLDGDLAPNNGGWQWAASTGCDPQPYFRIFNPLLQSEKFDPEGLYIKKYIPELRGFDSKTIHAPHLHGGAAGYPNPIVDHAVQKEKALKLYKVVS